MDQQHDEEPDNPLQQTTEPDIGQQHIGPHKRERSDLEAAEATRQHIANVSACMRNLATAYGVWDRRGREFKVTLEKAANHTNTKRLMCFN